MCDASAGAALGTNLFVAADDEDTTLRIYRSDEGGMPLQTIDVSRFLQVDPKRPEIDLEGAARIGDLIYWISSHGRNRTGKFRSSRLRFFATQVRPTERGPVPVPVGKYYMALLNDLFRDPRLRPFRLERAARLAPKAPGGLNIEGLSATPEGHLLIGFRNPIPDKKALIVPLLNPGDLIQVRRARFGDPILLDLDGLGIRDMGYWKGHHYIIAGSRDGSGRFRLYRWAGGKAKPEHLVDQTFGRLNPEALVFYPGRDQVQVLSDEGTAKVGGIDCKALTNPALKRFSSIWISPLPSPTP
jgi:hypothetical protein